MKICLMQNTHYVNIPKKPVYFFECNGIKECFQCSILNGLFNWYFCSQEKKQRLVDILLQIMVESVGFTVSCIVPL